MRAFLEFRMMKNVRLPRNNPKDGAFGVCLGLFIEAIFIFFPMTCMAVVLYDISLNGMRSVFAMIGVGAFCTWAIFRAVTFGMGKFDAVVDRFYERRRRKSLQAG